MSELVDRDHEHLNLLKLGFYVMAGMTGFFSLFALLYIILGGIFASIPFPTNANSPGNPQLFGMIIAFIGGGFLLIGLTVASLFYFAGRSIAKRHRRVFCLVMAGFSCLQIPWGTAIGVCAILVLSRPSVIALFDGPVPTPPIPAALPPPGGSVR